MEKKKKLLTREMCTGKTRRAKGNTNRLFVTVVYLPRKGCRVKKQLLEKIDRPGKETQKSLRGQDKEKSNRKKCKDMPEGYGEDRGLCSKRRSQFGLVREKRGGRKIQTTGSRKRQCRRSTRKKRKKDPKKNKEGGKSRVVGKTNPRGGRKRIKEESVSVVKNTGGEE